ncbi:hypothetical protein INR49_008040 [Caranx melampygus]|nr:hypothetical protein INR49_008040 [Caranx melampygus]
MGLREVTKHMKLHKIKCVIISPNCEKIQAKGGLDEALYNVIAMAREQEIPFVFALGRKALGRCVNKTRPRQCRRHLQLLWSRETNWRAWWRPQSSRGCGGRAQPPRSPTAQRDPEPPGSATTGPQPGSTPPPAQDGASDAGDWGQG